MPSHVPARRYLMCRPTYFDVTYSMNDGSEVRIETFTILERRDELIKSMKVYIDEGPLRGP